MSNKKYFPVEKESEDMVLLKVNLQLFAENDDEDDVDYSDDDVDGDDTDYSDDDEDEDVEGNEENDEDSLEDDAEDEEPEKGKDEGKKQKGKPDSKYEALRKKAEEEAQRKLDKERAELQAQRIELTERAVERKILDAITPEKIWEKADEDGISEAEAKKALEAEAKKLIDIEKGKVREHIKQVEKQKTELRSKPFFRELEGELEKFMDANPNWEYAEAYNYLLGKNYDKLHKKKAKSDEKSNIADAHDKMRRRSVSGGAKKRGTSGALSDFGREAAIAMGLDPRDISKHVSKRRGNFKI